METDKLVPSYAIAQENARFMSKVYLWMSGGVLLTFGVAYGVATQPEVAMAVISNRILFYALIIAQLGVVWSLSAWIQRMSAAMATALYLGYAGLTGLTLSVIFFVYTQESIAGVFMLTAFSFAGLSAFGYATKKDLGPVGSFCMMGLWGLLGFYLIGLFIPSMMSGVTQQVASLCGVVIFAGLTAYDTQKIKAMNVIGNEGTDEDHKEAIYGALTLYLDFINLFLSLLRLMGRRR